MMRAHAGFFRLLVKANGARKTVAVEQRHGGQSEFGGAAIKASGKRRAFEKAEGGAGVKFDVGHKYKTRLQSPGLRQGL